MGKRRVKFTVQRQSWALPFAFRYDFPCDWWVITVLCFHWAWPAEYGVEWGRFWRGCYRWMS